MTRDELAATYFTAAIRIHETATALYENCHTEDGEPISDTDQINKAIERAKASISIEYDLIQTVVQEYNE